MKHPHIPAMVEHRAKESPDVAAFRLRRGDTFVDVPWSKAQERIQAIAAGVLTAAPLDDGACVTVMGASSMDWVIIDFALLSVGLKTVPVYASLLPEEVGYMHVDTAAQLVVAEDLGQVEKVRRMRKGFKFFDKQYRTEDISLRGKIVVMDPRGLEPADDWESLADLEERGRRELAAQAAEIERRKKKLSREQVATFTYTSGTTGPPKAVIQTHENMLSMLEAVDSVGLFDDNTRRGGLFLFLPSAHSFGRLIELAGPFFGAPLVMSSVPTLAEDLGLSRPGFFPAAPRVYEKMAAKIQSALEGAPPTRRKLAHWALGVGGEASRYQREGKAVPFFLGWKLGIADKIVLSKLRARLGLDRCSVLLSGSAPLRSDVHELFLAMGCNLLEAYGLTETCPGLTTNLRGNIKVGTVGKAFPTVELRVADDGEILAKGPNITSGYLNRDDATREAFDDAGWFHTGDLGSLDDDGFLRITGRKKELLKTSGGKYVAPVKIEAMLKALPIVQEAVVIGDNRNFCTCLFALDKEMLGEVAQRGGFKPDPKAPEVKAMLEALVKKTNDTLASFEQIKTFRITSEPFSVDGGELTASLKVKRKTVADKYASLIDEMYASASASREARADA